MDWRLQLFAVPLSLVISFSTAAAQQNPDAGGLLVFNNACRTCHTIRPDDNRLGPNLYGILGRKSGTASGYRGYSSSMRNAGITWDEKNLEQFIANPDSLISGNGMKPFTGIGSAETRAAIITFIKNCASCGPSCEAPKMCSRR